MDRRAFLTITAAGVPGIFSETAEAADRVVRVTVTKEMLGAGVVSSAVPLPAIPPVTGSRSTPVPSWGKPLPYPIVIADRRNNRLLEVTPNQRIVWEPSVRGKWRRL
jgi:hypothetical protein